MTPVEAHYLAEFSESVGYLDFARVGPPSRSVIDATTAALAASALAGPTTVDELMGADARAVRAVSRLSGFDPDRVTLIPNTSTGLFQVATALGAGEVLVPAGEFPANVYPWVRAGQAGRVTVRTITGPGGGVTPTAVADALTPTTSAVTVSAVDFATGYRADLAGLRSVLGDRLLVVDGIQGFGVVDERWDEHVDVLVVGSQKWLRAGWGMGFLALSPRALDRLVPTWSGWTGVHDPTRYDGAVHARLPGAAQFSLTNLSPVNQAAFAAGLELLESVTPAWVATQVAARYAQLATALETVGAVVHSPRPAAERAGILTLSVPGVTTAALSRSLRGAGVSVTTHADRVRASIHASTTRADTDLLLEALPVAP